MTRTFAAAGFAAGIMAAAAIGSIAIAAPFADAGLKGEAAAGSVLRKADFGPEGGRKHGPRPFGPHGGPCPPLARMLADEEVAIGVRSAQLDAWRDYTDALLAVAAPPAPPKPDEGATTAFAFPQKMADDAIMRAKAAEKLKAAIEALKATLSPEQLERVARFAPPPPPPHFHRGPPPPEALPGQPSPGAGEPGQDPTAPR